MEGISKRKFVYDIESSASQSSLVSKNISIFDRRTSIRLEPEMWEALYDIAERERCSAHDICSLVYVRKSQKTSLTAAIRVFLMLYYKAAVTEEGHARAGHGDFNNMKRRARVSEKDEVLFNQSMRRKRKAFDQYKGYNDN